MHQALCSPRPLKRLPRFVTTTCRFRRATSGVAAVEFALILPVMLLLLVGMTELSNGIDNWRKVTLLSRTVADLTSQGDKQNPISQASMDDILKSSKLVLLPFNSAGTQIVVSALGVDIKNLSLKPRVCSSIASSNATARQVGVASDLDVPLGFQVNGTRYILAEVTMPYTPMLGSALVNLLGGANGQIKLVVKTPWPTRGGQPYGQNPYSEVVLPSGVACPAPL
jgi:Flp pilus assembly protein TadG